MSGARGLFRLKCLCFPRAGRIPLRRAKRGTSPVRRGGMPPSVGFADTSPGGGGYPYAVMVNKVTLCRVADEVSLYLRWLTRQVHMKDAGIQSIPQDVPMPGGAVPRGEVCKTGEAPARGAARSAAGGRRRRPKAGDAFRGGGTRPVPLTQNLRGKCGISPERPPAERVLPAPRAGERTLSAFLHWLRPLRPGSRNCPFPGSRGGDSLRYHVTIIARHACRNSRIRPARVPRNHFPRCKPRALPEIKDNRFPLHKRPVSTYPHPLL